MQDYACVEGYLCRFSYVMCSHLFEAHLELFSSGCQGQLNNRSVTFTISLSFFGSMLKGLAPILTKLFS